MHEQDLATCRYEGSLPLNLSALPCAAVAWPQRSATQQHSMAWQATTARLKGELDAVARLLRHRLAQREVAGVKHAVHVLHDLIQGVWWGVGAGGKERASEH